MHGDRRNVMLVVLVALGVWLASGCDTARSVAPQLVAPAASTPAGAVARLGWGFDHRDLDLVSQLLTEDFEFQSAQMDSAEDTVRFTVSPRSTFLAALNSLFNGVPGVSAPALVSLALDPNLVSFKDTRPGRNPTWHRIIHTAVEFKVFDATTQGSFDVPGFALFFITRGDSAAIPAELLALGVHPDSTRWWIDRWEDETTGGNKKPVNRITLGQVLSFYYVRLGLRPLVAERRP